MGKMKELELEKQEQADRDDWLLKKYAAAYGISLEVFKREKSK